MKASTSFVVGSEAEHAWQEVRQEPGPVRLEVSYSSDRLGPIWRPTDVTSKAAGMRLVRGLHGAPRPGRFRWVKGTPGDARELTGCYCPGDCACHRHPNPACGCTGRHS